MLHAYRIPHHLYCALPELNKCIYPFLVLRAVLPVIFVCHIQFLRIYHDGLATRSSYNERVSSVYFLDYLDGDLDEADPAEAIAKIVRYLRLVRPGVVVTFGPFGGYGHPDHIAISQFTTAAIVEAANQESLCYRDLAAHSVSKLYYMAETAEVFGVYQSVFGDLVMHINGVKRGIVTWPGWSVTTRIDTWSYSQTVARAISCHRTQLPAYHLLEDLPQEQRETLWSTQSYYRAFSRVNGGGRLEDDLF